MYGIFAYMYHENQPNVVKYTIHGSCGVWLVMVDFQNQLILSLAFDQKIDFFNPTFSRQKPCHIRLDHTHEMGGPLRSLLIE